jgi:hypothetical protein
MSGVPLYAMPYAMPPARSKGASLAEKTEGF